MESTSFKITVNDKDYDVKVHSAVPVLYDVNCGAAYHQIGKTDAGLWVYVENSTSPQHMPLQQIGKEIEAYLLEQEAED